MLWQWEGLVRRSRGSHIFSTSYNWTPSQIKAFQVQSEKNSLWVFLERRTNTVCTVLVVRIPCCRQRYHQRTGKKRARCARPRSIKRLVETHCSLIEKKKHVSRLAVAERLLLNSPYLPKESKWSEIYVQMWATRMRAVKQTLLTSSSSLLLSL